MAKSRGGQPGNSNALKHGFYSSRFSNIELTDLETALHDGLGSEIALLRVLIRRFSEKLDQEDPTIEEAASHLLTIGSAMAKLAHLLRTDHVLSGGQESAVMDAIHAALCEVTEDLKNA